MRGWFRVDQQDTLDAGESGVPAVNVDIISKIVAGLVNQARRLCLSLPSEYTLFSPRHTGEPVHRWDPGQERGRQPQRPD